MKYIFLGLVLLGFVPEVYSIEIISKNKRTYCEEINLNKDLILYKDPELFLSNLSVMMHVDPELSVEELTGSDGPVLTTFRGKIQLMRLEPPREFRNFFLTILQPKFRKTPQLAKKGVGENLRTDEVTKIIPVKICGGMSDPYRDSVGFIVESDLASATAEDYEAGTLPPSIYPNPIPKIKVD